MLKSQIYVWKKYVVRLGIKLPKIAAQWYHWFKFYLLLHPGRIMCDYHYELIIIKEQGDGSPKGICYSHEIQSQLPHSFSPTASQIFSPGVMYKKRVRCKWMWKILFLQPDMVYTTNNLDQIPWGSPIGLNKDTFMCLDAYKNKTIYKSQVKLDHFK